MKSPPDSVEKARGHSSAAAEPTSLVPATVVAPQLARNLYDLHNWLNSRASQ